MAPKRKIKKGTFDDGSASKRIKIRLTTPEPQDQNGTIPEQSSAPHEQQITARSQVLINGTIPGHSSAPALPHEQQMITRSQVATSLEKTPVIKTTTTRENPQTPK